MRTALCSILFILFIAAFIGVPSRALAGESTGEFGIGIQGIKFRDQADTKPFLALEVGARDENIGVGLLFGHANVESHSFTVAGTNYEESLDYYPFEANLKGFLLLKDIDVELSGGGGVSMNYLEYTLDDKTNDKNVTSSSQVLFGAQALAEVKLLFPTSAGKYAFVALEFRQQWVDHARTPLGDMDLSNYRVGIKLGGIF